MIDSQLNHSNSCEKDDQELPKLLVGKGSGDIYLVFRKYDGMSPNAIFLSGHRIGKLGTVSCFDLYEEFTGKIILSNTKHRR